MYSPLIHTEEDGIPCVRNYVSDYTYNICLLPKNQTNKAAILCRNRKLTHISYFYTMCTHIGTSHLTTNGPLDSVSKKRLCEMLRERCVASFGHGGCVFPPFTLQPHTGSHCKCMCSRLPRGLLLCAVGYIFFDFYHLPCHPNVFCIVLSFQKAL